MAETLRQYSDFNGAQDFQISRLNPYDADNYARPIQALLYTSWLKRFTDEALIPLTDAEKLKQHFNPNDPNFILEQKANISSSSPESSYYVAELANPREDDLAIFGLAKVVSRRQIIVYDIDVHPTFQRKGIGSALLDVALEKFSQRSQVSLNTYGENRQAKKWYEIIGFRQVATGAPTFAHGFNKPITPVRYEAQIRRVRRRLKARQPAIANYQ